MAVIGPSHSKKKIDVSTRTKDFESLNINPRDYLEKYVIMKIFKDRYKDKYVLSDYSYFYTLVYGKAETIIYPVWSFCSFDQIKYTKFFELNEVKTMMQEIIKWEATTKLKYMQGNEQLDLYGVRYTNFINDSKGTSYWVQKHIGKPIKVKKDIKYQIMSGIKYIQFLKRAENEQTIGTRRRKRAQRKRSESL